MTPKSPPVCDYAGYDYKKEFWGGQDRRYEDYCERSAIRYFLTRLAPRPKRLLDAGCGFGRLFGAYHDLADRFVLLDYAQNMLDEARASIRTNASIEFVQGNLTQIPLEDNSVDAIISVRTLHHLENPALFISEAFRVLAPGGSLIFEVPNKRHGLNILKAALGRLKTPVFSGQPLKLGENFYNFHPKTVKTDLNRIGFQVRGQKSTSFMRIGLLKRLLPYRFLGLIDRVMGACLSRLLLTPSHFFWAQKP